MTQTRIFTTPSLLGLFKFMETPEKKNFWGEGVGVCFQFWCLIIVVLMLQTRVISEHLFPVKFWGSTSWTKQGAYLNSPL